MKENQICKIFIDYDRRSGHSVGTFRASLLISIYQSPWSYYKKSNVVKDWIVKSFVMLI
jgi:hypothetical protein